MEERKETEQEFYDNNQKLLNLIGSNYDYHDQVLNRIINSIKDVESYEAYMALLTLCKYINSYIDLSIEDTKWFDYVSNRLAAAKLDDLGIQIAANIC